MKHKNPYFELDVRYIGTQDRTPEQIKKDMEFTGQFIKDRKSSKVIPSKKKRKLNANPQTYITQP